MSGIPPTQHGPVFDPNDPPVAPPSVFRGRGMFTVERPGDADGLKLDYVLEAVDAFTWRMTWGVVCQDESAEQFAHALTWVAPTPSVIERALVTTLDGSYHPLGSWPAGWTCMPECYWNADGGHVDHTIEPRLTYGRSVPNMLFRARQVIGDKWGTVPVVPVIGCYDASGENPGVGVRLTVPDYLPDLEMAMQAEPCVVGYAVWRVETLNDTDRRALT